MSTPVSWPDGAPGRLTAALAALRAEVEVGGARAPGSPRAPRPVPLGTAVLGGTLPLVAVATTAGSEPEAARQALAASTRGADLVELRADLIEPEPGAPAAPQHLAAAWTSPGLAAARLLAARQRTTPLLLTVRTTAEAGGADVDDATYRRALLTAAGLIGEARSTGLAENVRAIDVEIARGCLGEVSSAAHVAGLAVVASAHFFTSTPSEEQVVSLLRHMQQEGADAAKLAVMPRGGSAGHDDVLTLLRATARARAELEVPVITMSMGEQGVPTRMVGGVFGSALTFATAGARASAPGQPQIAEVQGVLARLASQPLPH
ncbi:type I 3-dehydroquinate dehydratase [Actinomyces sp. W5033]|uniref:type I 3-dehydroquinate dehydratase n=1 Tax=Actinomyces sp. W5033 TaxID=3446479 RepID=UPI003EE21149